MKTVVRPKNITAFRIWFEKLGYQVTNLQGNGFTARTCDRGIKKKHHYVLVTDNFSGNAAAFELGREFEQHLISPLDALSVKTKDGTNGVDYFAT